MLSRLGRYCRIRPLAFSVGAAFPGMMGCREVGALPMRDVKKEGKKPTTSDRSPSTHPAPGSLGPQAERRQGGWRVGI
jgi:hypothetical protein